MKKTVKKALGIGSLALIGSMGYLNIAHAKFGLFEEDFGKVLETIFNFAFGAAGVVFVVLFLVGGVQYLSSAGNEESSTKAKKLLIDAVIGLVIVVVSYAAARWIVSGIGGTISDVLQ
jgi:hypothetical protein